MVLCFIASAIISKGSLQIFSISLLNSFFLHFFWINFFLFWFFKMITNQNVGIALCFHSFWVLLCSLQIHPTLSWWFPFFVFACCRFRLFSGFQLEPTEPIVDAAKKKHKSPKHSFFLMTNTIKRQNNEMQKSFWNQHFKKDRIQNEKKKKNAAENEKNHHVIIRIKLPLTNLANCCKFFF